MTLTQLTDEFIRMHAPSGNCAECEAIREAIRFSPNRFKYFITRCVNANKGFRMWAEGVYWEVYPDQLKAESCGCGGAVVETKTFTSLDQLEQWSIEKFYTEKFNAISIHDELINHNQQSGDIKANRAALSEANAKNPKGDKRRST